MPHLLAGLAVAAGLLARLWRIADRPLWLDEAYSAFAARHDLAYIWSMVPRYETHPPFYYALLHGWTLIFGDSVSALRALGLICGILTVPVVGCASAALARLAEFDRSGRRWVVAMAVTFVSLQPLSIAMTQQVRPYPLMMLAYAVALLALIRLAPGRARQPLARGWLTMFFVCQLSILWLHALGVLFGIALGLALLLVVVRRDLRPTDWAWLLLGEALVALLYLPALVIVLHESQSWSQSTWLRFEPETVPRALGFLYMTWNGFARVIAISAAVGGSVALLRRYPARRMAGALLIAALLPTMLSIALSILKTPVFLDRTLSPVSVAGFLLMTACFGPARRWRFVALPFALYLMSSAISVDLFIARQPPVQQWYLVRDWLVRRIRPGDVVWAYPNEAALGLIEALNARHIAMPIRQIPGDVPYLGPLGRHVTGSGGTVALDDREIAALLPRRNAVLPPTIWLLRLNKQLYDPQDRMLDALRLTRVPVARINPGPIDLIGLRRKNLPPVTAPQQPQP